MLNHQKIDVILQWLAGQRFQKYSNKSVWSLFSHCEFKVQSFYVSIFLCSSGRSPRMLLGFLGHLLFCFSDFNAQKHMSRECTFCQSLQARKLQCSQRVLLKLFWPSNIFWNFQLHFGLYFKDSVEPRWQIPGWFSVLKNFI